MQPLFDFGISQEDPLTEFNLLDIQQFDQVLCVSSGGEMPLSLLCFQPGANITAVDISAAQLTLSRLKLQAAILLPFPKNGQFLGYASAEPKWRRKIYHDIIHTKLSKDDQDFWMRNLKAIDIGVVNMGRFEGYIKKIRGIVRVIVGRRNIEKLLSCSDLSEQENVFDKYIGTRKAVHLLFRIAFHPVIYRNRGLKAQGLIHAKSKAGEIFYNKFRGFCTTTPIDRNYFLQYFLTGECRHEKAFPEFLQESFRSKLALNWSKIRWKLGSLEHELAENPPGTFNKVHLSNIGDWMSKEDFSGFLDILCSQSADNAIMCYRFLQKRHFMNGACCGNRFDVKSSNREKTDRFPFYSILSIHSHGKE